MTTAITQYDDTVLLSLVKLITSTSDLVDLQTIYNAEMTGYGVANLETGIPADAYVQVMPSDLDRTHPPAAYPCVRVDITKSVDTVGLNGNVQRTIHDLEVRTFSSDASRPIRTIGGVDYLDDDTYHTSLNLRARREGALVRNAVERNLIHYSTPTDNGVFNIVRTGAMGPRPFLVGDPSKLRMIYTFKVYQNTRSVRAGQALS